MRVKTAVPRHRKIKRLKKATKGFHGGRRRLLRTMKDAEILLTPEHPEASVEHVVRVGDRIAGYRMTEGAESPGVGPGFSRMPVDETEPGHRGESDAFVIEELEQVSGSAEGEESVWNVGVLDELGDAPEHRQILVRDLVGRGDDQKEHVDRFAVHRLVVEAGAVEPERDPEIGDADSSAVGDRDAAAEPGRAEHLPALEQAGELRSGPLVELKETNQLVNDRVLTAGAEVERNRGRAEEVTEPHGEAS